MKMNPHSRKISLFLGLTFLINWSLAGLYFALGGKWGSPSSMVMVTGYMFVPMIVTIVIQKFIYKESLKEPLGISFQFNRWFIIAWLLPFAISFAALGVSLLFPSVEYSPHMEGLLERYKSIFPPEQFQKIKVQMGTRHLSIWMGILMALVAGITVNAIAGFGEELGWRGFLQKEFSFLGFWKSSIWIGFIWGIWHAPLILHGHNYPQHPFIGVIMMTLWCILLGILFSYIRFQAQSVIAAAIIHGSLNASYGFSIALVKGGNDLLVGTTGFAGFLVLATLNLAIYIYDSHFKN